MDFATWEKSVKSTQTIEVGRDVIRDIYPTPNGISIMHDICIPRNIFARQCENSIVMYTLPEDKKELVVSAGGRLSKDYYTEDGYGTPVFCGKDCLKKAFIFALTLK